MLNIDSIKVITSVNYSLVRQVLWECFFLQPRLWALSACLLLPLKSSQRSHLKKTDNYRRVKFKNFGNLYSAAIDRIKDYGTLKAIGATNGYIRKLILMQAVIYAIIGFLIGYALIEGFRNGIANAGTLFTFHPVTKVIFFLITATISISGTLFAIRRITKLEPASVFRT